MEIIIEFVICSEDENLNEQGNFFRSVIKDCEIEYIKNSEHKQYCDEKISKNPRKNSTLYIRQKTENYKYNKAIIDIINAYDQLNSYFSKIVHEAYILIDFYYDKDYPLSLEFGEEVLKLLCKHHFSLPISCYSQKDIR